MSLERRGTIYTRTADYPKQKARPPSHTSTCVLHSRTHLQTAGRCLSPRAPTPNSHTQGRMHLRGLPHPVQDVKPEHQGAASKTTSGPRGISTALGQLLHMTSAARTRDPATVWNGSAQCMLGLENRIPFSINVVGDLGGKEHPSPTRNRR